MEEKLLQQELKELPVDLEEVVLDQRQEDEKPIENIIESV
jgi:hypothetical protein